MIVQIGREQVYGTAMDELLEETAAELAAEAMGTSAAPLPPMQADLPL